MDMFDTAKNRMDEMFEEMKGCESIDARQRYDVLIGFIEGLRWMHVLTDEMCVELGHYALEKTFGTYIADKIEKEIKKELKNEKLGM